MAFSKKVAVKVAIAAGGRCCFPGCRELLTEYGSNLSEFAHISGDKKKSARHDSSLSEEYRQSAENAAAMCLKHHKVIDDNPEDYSVVDIHEWKSKHEEWVKNNNKTVDLLAFKIKEINELISRGDIGKAQNNLDFIEEIAENEGTEYHAQTLVLKARCLRFYEKHEDAAEELKYFVQKNPSVILTQLAYAEILLTFGNSEYLREIIKRTRH